MGGCESSIVECGTDFCRDGPARLRVGSHLGFGVEMDVVGPRVRFGCFQNVVEAAVNSGGPWRCKSEGGKPKTYPLLRALRQTRFVGKGRKVTSRERNVTNA